MSLMNQFVGNEDSPLSTLMSQEVGNEKNPVPALMNVEVAREGGEYMRIEHETKYIATISVMIGGGFDINEPLKLKVEHASAHLSLFHSVRESDPFQSTLVVKIAEDDKKVTDQFRAGIKSLQRALQKDTDIGPALNILFSKLAFECRQLGARAASELLEETLKSTKV